MLVWSTYVSLVLSGAVTVVCCCCCWSYASSHFPVQVAKNTFPKKKKTINNKQKKLRQGKSRRKFFPPSRRLLNFSFFSSTAWMVFLGKNYRYIWISVISWSRSNEKNAVLDRTCFRKGIAHVLHRRCAQGSQALTIIVTKRPFLSATTRRSQRTQNVGVSRFFVWSKKQPLLSSHFHTNKEATVTLSCVYLDPKRVLYTFGFIGR